jgi:hypothetical protein
VGGETRSRFGLSERIPQKQPRDIELAPPASTAIPGVIAAGQAWQVVWPFIGRAK